jgi:hypothetical protein
MLLVMERFKNLTNGKMLWLPCYLCVTDSDIFSYRDVPPFGRETIRKFSNNVSAMKRFAARDFEDLLQVCYSNLFNIMF